MQESYFCLTFSCLSHSLHCLADQWPYLQHFSFIKLRVYLLRIMQCLRGDTSQSLRVIFFDAGWGDAVCGSGVQECFLEVCSDSCSYESLSAVHFEYQKAFDSVLHFILMCMARCISGAGGSLQQGSGDALARRAAAVHACMAVTVVGSGLQWSPMRAPLSSID